MKFGQVLDYIILQLKVQAFVFHIFCVSFEFFKC